MQIGDMTTYTLPLSHETLPIAMAFAKLTDSKAADPAAAMLDAINLCGSLMHEERSLYRVVTFVRDTDGKINDVQAFSPARAFRNLSPLPITTSAVAEDYHLDKIDTLSHFAQQSLGADFKPANRAAIVHAASRYALELGQELFVKNRELGLQVKGGNQVVYPYCISKLNGSRCADLRPVVE